LDLIRDDRPSGGPDPPAAVYFFSRDRSGDHPRRHLAITGLASFLPSKWKN